MRQAEKYRLAGFFLFFFMAAFLPLAGYAQQDQGAAVYFAREIASACLGTPEGSHKWTDQSCLKALSASTLAFGTDYTVELQNSGQQEAAQTIINHCAAATAAAQKEIPADALAGAMTECANTISDVAAQTGLAPNLSHYQLVVYPVFCLNPDDYDQCSAFEKELSRYLNAL